MKHFIIICEQTDYIYTLFQTHRYVQKEGSTNATFKRPNDITDEQKALQSKKAKYNIDYRKSEKEGFDALQDRCSSYGGHQVNQVHPADLIISWQDLI